ncbi:MAG TPA: response regulator [Candidatus Limnocylindrales bacterium]|nr:response regulator [Candidatus Limnocylindrales bacterium]
MGKARILAVEDEADILEFLKEFLISGGYEVATALSGEQALQLLNGQKFDLLVVDLKMPRVNGLEVIKRARELDPNILGILITGDFTFSGNLQELGHAGIYSWLFKPLGDINQLLLMIQRALEYQDCQREIKKLKDELKVLNQTPSTQLEGLSFLSEEVTKHIRYELQNYLSLIRTFITYLTKKLEDTDEAIRKHLERLDRQTNLCEKTILNLLEPPKKKERI